MAAEEPNTADVQTLDDLTMWQIATLALFERSGARQRVDSEDIAIRCHKLSPGRFGWKKHRHLPNLSATAEALNDARRTRNGALIVGSPTEHWMLTSAGVDWARRHLHLLSTSSQQQATQLTAREQRELRDLRAHPLFVRWQQGSQPPAGNLIASGLLLSASSPSVAIKRRLEQLDFLAHTSADSELKEYIAWLNAAFTESH